jgi:two-component system, NarL family, sensor kinase
MNQFIWGLLISTLLLFTVAAAFFYLLCQYRLKISLQQVRAKSMEQAYQEQLLSSIIATQESERRRIAADLHDDLGALLSLIGWYIDGSMQESRNVDTEFSKNMVRARQLIDMAIAQVKRIAYDMAPHGLEELGLDGAVKRLLEQMDVNRKLKISVSFHHPKLRLPLAQEIMLFRVLQELFNNIQKHSAATFIHIVQHYADGIYKIFLEHDGQGLVQETFEQLRKIESNIGLQNIYSRLCTAGATINFSEAKGLFTTGIQVSLSHSQQMKELNKLLYGFG